MGSVNQGRTAGKTGTPGMGFGRQIDPHKLDLKEFIQKMRACGVTAKPPRAVLPLRTVPSPAGTLHLRMAHSVTSMLTVYPEDVGRPAFPRILGEKQMRYENNTVVGEGNVRAGYYVGSIYPDSGGRLLATLKYPEQKMVVLYFERS